MFVRYLTAAAALVALAIAAPASAGSTEWRHSGGSLTLTLPSIIVPDPKQAEWDQWSLFVVRRGGADVGACLLALPPADDPPLSATSWMFIVGDDMDNPEATARRAAGAAGQTFVKFGGAKSYDSPAGWAGYVYWFEQINKTSGKAQTALNAGTMLGVGHELKATCTSKAGFTFRPPEVEAIVSFITSARRG